MFHTDPNIVILSSSKPNRKYIADHKYYSEFNTDLISGTPTQLILNLIDLDDELLAQLKKLPQETSVILYGTNQSELWKKITLIISNYESKTTRSQCQMCKII